MQNPYNKYLSNQNMGGDAPKKKKDPKKPRPQRRKKSKKPSKGPEINWVVAALCLFGFSASFYVFTYTDEVMDVVSKIEIGMNKSFAADDKKPPGKVSAITQDTDHLTMKNANVYQALKDKRRELEKKERRLSQLEEELEIQKKEIQKQLQEMQEMRRNIASKLDNKVKMDEDSLKKLVGVYSNMKPANAAVVLSQVDDELAIQVLGQMKKQNAAAILNYVAPKKAQYLSEKFTGLKK